MTRLGWKSLWAGPAASLLSHSAMSHKMEGVMIRLIAVALALAVTSSANALPVTPLEQADDMIIQVREGCGLGRQLLDGVCVRNSKVRAIVRKCRAKKMRVVNGRCQPRTPVQPAKSPS